MNLRSLVFLLALAIAGAANAAIVTYTDVDLASGNPVTVGGVTLTTSTTNAGGISFIGGGTFTGLHLRGQ